MLQKNKEALVTVVVAAGGASVVVQTGCSPRSVGNELGTSTITHVSYRLMELNHCGDFVFFCFCILDL